VNRIDSERLSPAFRLRRGPWLQVYTPWRFEWNRYELPIPGLPQPLNGLRIVHLTDVHLRPTWRRVYDEVLERIGASKPDLILISGDLIEHKFNHRPTLPVVERFAERLHARLGVHAILGNHDGDLLGGYLHRFGLNLINGRIARPCHAQAPVEIVGMPGVTRGDAEEGFLAQVPPHESGSLRIVMSHYPDAIQHVGAIRPDLLLTGHTHGGQVCLPGGWPIIRHSALPRRLCRGVHRINDTWLVVGRGLGFATHQIRVFCPAEVIELELRCA
jgi:predicted MPP superfamily phosphohydrolase